MNVLRRLNNRNGTFNHYLTKIMKYDLKRTFIGQTYEGTGKTTGYILNKKGAEVLLFDFISTEGFRLTNGWKLMGPIVIFPHTFLSWNIKNLNDINEESLSLFTKMQPKLEVLFFGYGRREDISVEQLKNFTMLFKRLHINSEIMPTEDACATFNFCSYDRRFIAAAVIPPSKVTFHHEFDPTIAKIGTETPMVV